MEIDIEVNDIAQSPVTPDFFVSVAQETIEMARYEFLKEKKISISLAIVSEEEIQELNRQYRDNDRATDILSFCEYETKEDLEDIGEEEIFLGELILCYNDVVKYAEEEDIDLQKELTTVFSHGVLHLLGFSHGEEMFAIQKKVTNKI